MNAKVHPIPNDSIDLPSQIGKVGLKGIRNSILRGLISLPILLLIFSFAIANAFEQTALMVYGSPVEAIAKTSDSTLNKNVKNQDSLDIIKNTELNSIKKEPEQTDFIIVDKEPGIDLQRLMSLVVYPKLARKAGIQGVVVLRLMVSDEGKVNQVLIEYSENLILNSAAEDAIMEYGDLIPAIKDGKPIACWVSIPIRFRLR